MRLAVQVEKDCDLFWLCVPNTFCVTLSTRDFDRQEV